MSAPQLFVSPRAREDLSDIWLWLSRSSPDNADRFLDEVEALFERLREHPQLGRARPELRAGLRSFPVRRYIVFYRLGPGSVEIVRVLHGRQDVNGAF